MKPMVQHILKAARLLLAFDDQEILVLRYLATTTHGALLEDIANATDHAFDVKSILKKLISEGRVTHSYHGWYTVLPLLCNTDKIALIHKVFPDLLVSGTSDNFRLYDSYGANLEVSSYINHHSLMMHTCNKSERNRFWNTLSLMDADAFEEYLRTYVLDHAQCCLNKPVIVTEDNFVVLMLIKCMAIETFNASSNAVTALRQCIHNATINANVLMLANDLEHFKLKEDDAANEQQLEKIIVKLTRAIQKAAK